MLNSVSRVFLPRPLPLDAGLGVDDVYIVLLAIKKQGGYKKRHWLKAMREVAIPVTMTSLVNASMFAIMSLSDVPAVYQTSQVACFCVIALYFAVLFCFPAYCYLDLKRQASGHADCLVCMKRSNPPDAKKKDFRNMWLYGRFYRPLVLASNERVRSLVHLAILLVSVAIFAVGAWGITERDVGLEISEFVPKDKPAHRWSVVFENEVTGGAINMNWGALDYTDPDVQMKMTKQFENVVATPNVGEADTKLLWIADFSIWTSRHCTHNVDRESFDGLRCGRDQRFDGDGSYCEGSWVSNKFDLREKVFRNITDSTCAVTEGGVCRPRDQMHSDDLAALDDNSKDGQVFCPVVEGWSDEKWQFCLGQWFNLTDALHTFVFDDGEKDSPTQCRDASSKPREIKWPVPYSSSPILYVFGDFDTLVFMSETRHFCDDDNELHCWMSGTTYDYSTQYIDIFEFLMSLAAYATLAGFGVAFLFLLGKLSFENHHPRRQVFIGSLIGALLIAAMIILTLVSVIGLSVLVGVNLTGFSNLSFILSVGFSVEYSVHIVSRWMRANMSHTTSLKRVHHTMSFLMLPTFMSFVSSTIGVICLAFTDFGFINVYFFRPLMIVMFVSYWFGCWLLPTILIYLDFDIVKLGKPSAATTTEASEGFQELEASPGDKDSNVDRVHGTVDEHAEQRRFSSVSEDHHSDSRMDSRTLLRPDPPSGPSFLFQMEEEEEE